MKKFKITTIWRHFKQFYLVKKQNKNYNRLRPFSRTALVYLKQYWLECKTFYFAKMKNLVLVNKGVRTDCSKVSIYQNFLRKSKSMFGQRSG